MRQCGRTLPPSTVCTCFAISREVGIQESTHVRSCTTCLLRIYTFRLFYSVFRRIFLSPRFLSVTWSSKTKMSEVVFLYTGSCTGLFSVLDALQREVFLPFPQTYTLIGLCYSQRNSVPHASLHSTVFIRLGNREIHNFKMCIFESQHSKQFKRLRTFPMTYKLR
jgi:hypothetical protein